MEDTSYMTRREGDKYYCTFKRCDKKYIHKRQAEDHYYTHHLNQPQYFCQLCDKTFSFRESLQSHNKLVHNGSTEYSIISPQTANRSPHGNCSTSIRIGEVPSKPPIRPLPGLRAQEQQQHQQNHHHHPQQQLPSHSQPQQIVSNPVPGRPGTRASTGSLSTTSQASTSSSGYGSNEHPSNPRIVARVTASANGSHHITWTSPQQDFSGRNTRRSQGQAIQAVVPPTVQMDSSEPEYEVDDFDENMDYFEEDDGVDGEVGFEEIDEGEVSQVTEEREPVRCTCCGGLFLSQLLLNRHQSMQGEKKDSS